MKTERDVFDLWFKKNFYDLHEAICCGDLVAKNYKKAMFKAWQASASREGYKLVPVNPTDEMISTYRDKSIAPISTLSVIGYKAMIGAAP